MLRVELHARAVDRVGRAAVAADRDQVRRAAAAASALLASASQVASRDDVVAIELVRGAEQRGLERTAARRPSGPATMRATSASLIPTWRPIRECAAHSYSERHSTPTRMISCWRWRGIVKSRRECGDRRRCAARRPVDCARTCGTRSRSERPRAAGSGSMRAALPIKRAFARRAAGRVGDAGRQSVRELRLDLDPSVFANLRVHRDLAHAVDQVRELIRVVARGERFPSGVARRTRRRAARRPRAAARPRTAPSRARRARARSARARRPSGPRAERQARAAPIDSWSERATRCAATAARGAAAAASIS